VTSKEPVLLTILVETEPLRWFAAGIRLTGDAIPLLRSEEGNLADYLGARLDDQVSFLRHRFAGVLQRGCDRLWARNLKPCQFVFVADDWLAHAPADLTHRLAAHLVEWMVNPGVTFLRTKRRFDPNRQPALETIAGSLSPEQETALTTALPGLFEEIHQPERWELIAKPKPTRVS
jgi:hypothetical protein